MGVIKDGQFLSAYYGDQIDALLAAMAQANPLPSGTDWVAFIDDCRAAQSAAEAAQTAAETAEDNAASSASTASQKATQAATSATTAYTASENAAASAQAASGYASTASTKAGEAAASASDAAGSATAAANSATSASNAAVAAQGAAATAAAQAASQAAEAAATQTAAAIRGECEGYVDASESWAVGGTGTRAGEDTDNSKYYCEQAQAAAEQASVPPVEGVYNIILADRTVSGAKYAMVFYNGRLKLVGVSSAVDATDVSVVDPVSGTTYLLAASNGRLIMEEV